MSITKKYYVGITGLENSKGYIDLTEEEAETVRKVINPNNWQDATLNPWSRKFFIVETNKSE